jgi:beta-galactosidase GanA
MVATTMLARPTFSAAFAVAAMLTATALTHAAGRFEVRGRDLYRDGKPHIPHGMVHVPRDQFSTLVRMGMNSVHVDLPFRMFDPRRSDEENRAEYDSFLHTADLAASQGLSVLWLLSFHYAPDWLYERHPDVRMKTHDGKDAAGGFIDMCLNHPGFREDAANWLKVVARMFGAHPATLDYCLWNEPHLTSAVDYHPHAVGAFHD